MQIGKRQLSLEEIPEEELEDYSALTPMSNRKLEIIKANSENKKNKIKNKKGIENINESAN